MPKCGSGKERSRGRIGRDLSVHKRVALIDDGGDGCRGDIKRFISCGVDDDDEGIETQS